MDLFGIHSRRNEAMEKLDDDVAQYPQFQILETSFDVFHQVSGVKATLLGPVNTPYEGATFVIDIKRPKLSLLAPAMKFETKIWHPNVDVQTGTVTDTRFDEWPLSNAFISPLRHIEKLLQVPWPCKSDDGQAARMFMHFPAQFDEVARAWAVEHAGAPTTGLTADEASCAPYAALWPNRVREIKLGGSTSWHRDSVERKAVSASQMHTITESLPVPLGQLEGTPSNSEDRAVVSELRAKEGRPSVNLNEDLRNPWLRHLHIGAQTAPPEPQVGQRRVSKIKRGLSGFINATRVSAIADTGSAQNIISAEYATNLKLPIMHGSTSFQLGNSRIIQSTGTVRLPWAFADDPLTKYNLLFHVLPKCTYDLIIGMPFLIASETLSKFRRRLTKCVFSITSCLKFGFLGDRCHRLSGVLDDMLPVSAVPDTGAERNVMDAKYAKSHGFNIDTGPGTQNFLQFADGSYQETIGQVTTHWTFPSGKKVLLTFEILEDCASEVVIGEDFLFEHRVFTDHASSLQTSDFDSDSYELAPFDFINSWQQKYLNLKAKLRKPNNQKTPTGFIDTMSVQTALRTPSNAQQERHRRDVWNHRFEFGNKASPEEMQVETKRRGDYERRSVRDGNSDHHQGGGGQTFRVPSVVPTSSSATSPSECAIPNFSRPRPP